MSSCRHHLSFMTSLDLGIDFGAKRSECRDRDRDSLVQPRRSSCAPERQDGAKSMAILEQTQTEASIKMGKFLLITILATLITTNVSEITFAKLDPIWLYGTKPVLVSGMRALGMSRAEQEVREEAYRTGSAATGALIAFVKGKRLVFRCLWSGVWDALRLSILALSFMEIGPFQKRKDCWFGKATGIWSGNWRAEFIWSSRKRVCN